MNAALRWTSADLEVMPDNGKRYEIIDGELYVSKSPTYHHQFACGQIFAHLNSWSLETGLGVANFGTGIIFADDDDVIPDVVWISRDRFDKILGDDGHFHAAPDLVVEVLSPGSANEKRDRETKLKLYSRRGVLEYWIVNWLLGEISVYRRKGKALKLQATLRSSDTLTSKLLPGFKCEVKASSTATRRLANRIMATGKQGINPPTEKIMQTNRKRIILLSLCATAFLIGLGAPLLTGTTNAQRKLRLLYVTQSINFRHQSLHQSEEIMEQLGAKNGFDVTITQMAEAKLTPENLKNLDVIVFYTTGELPLSDAQKKALLDWVKSGKFFMGLHSATDTFYKWPEYGEMINGYFDGHPWTQDVEVTIKVDDRTHPVSRHLPESMTFKEEIYQLKDFDPAKVKVLASLDTTKTDMTRKGIKAKQFPLVYYRDYGKGKALYNAFGHRPDVWTAEWYQTMIVNSIKWGTGQMK